MTKEKKLIHEINQLKQLVLSASKNQGVALDGMREKNEKHLEDLRYEMNAMIERLSRLEQATNAAQIEYDEANKKQKQLLDQYKNDNFVCHCVLHLYLISPKKQCSDKVESVMNLSNEDGNFGKEYIGCNQRNIMRNFGTLDGRRLAPDEKMPSLSFVPGSKALTLALVAPVSKLTKSDPHLAAEADNSGQKDSEEESDRMQNDSSRMAEKEEIKELAEAPRMVEKKEDKEPIKLERIQDELAAKEDRLRIEEEAARLKELRRQEEKLKAQEALASKKRMLRRPRLGSSLRRGRKLKRRKRRGKSAQGRRRTGRQTVIQGLK